MGICRRQRRRDRVIAEEKGGTVCIVKSFCPARRSEERERTIRLAPRLGSPWPVR